MLKLSSKDLGDSGDHYGTAKLKREKGKRGDMKQNTQGAKLYKGNKRKKGKGKGKPIIERSGRSRSLWHCQPKQSISRNSLHRSNISVLDTMLSVQLSQRS